MNITQTKDIRTANRWRLYKQVLHHYPISRAKLATITGLNKATVSAIVKEWMDIGLLEETERESTASGRKPILLMPRLDAGHILAIEIDVTSVRLVLTTLSTENILLHESFSITESHFASVYKQLIQTIDSMLKQEPAARYGLVGIGVAIHGIVDLSGLIRFVPRLGWRNIDLKVLLQERYHVPVFVDNDGNLAARAEYSMAEMEQQKPYQSLAVVNIGASISAGLIVNGSLLRGHHGFANAIGHQTIKFDEPRQCFCGRYGCWEQYCTDSAMIAQANQKLEKPVSSIEELADRIRHQDPAAEEILHEFIYYLAIGITNMVFWYDCEAIAVSSQLLSALPYEFPNLLQKVVLPITHSEHIYLSMLGRDGAILGAANDVQEHFFQEITDFSTLDK